MEYDTEQLTFNMIKQCTEFKNKTVLEIGCGSGKLSSLLADVTEDYIGIDPEVNAINNASQTYENVDFRVGRGESLAFTDSRFDLVLFTLSLHHHQNSSLALKEAARVLKEQGRLVVIEPSIEGEFQQFFHLFYDETHEIQTAYQNLINSDFILENEDTFNAIVIFEGKEDLCSYSFDRETIAPGDADRIIEKLSQLQPGEADHSPIIIKDTINIYILSKI